MVKKRPDSRLFYSPDNDYIIDRTFSGFGQVSRELNTNQLTALSVILYILREKIFEEAKGEDNE
jgi:hypothetical protein